VDGRGKFVQDVVIARQGGEFAMVRSSDVTLMDVSPNQLVSVAASLVPFLEHDDAQRALMGSNMQRQAVPLLRTEPPFVGTGMESVVAGDSGAAVVAKRSGVVEGVDARRIVVRSEEPDASGCTAPTSTRWSSTAVRTRTPASTRSRSSPSDRRSLQGR